LQSNQVAWRVIGIKFPSDKLKVLYVTRPFPSVERSVKGLATRDYRERKRGVWRWSTCLINRILLYLREKLNCEFFSVPSYPRGGFPRW